MKTKKSTAIALAAASLAILSGCGKSNDPAFPIGGINNGIMPGNGACVPITQQIAFAGQNSYLSALRLVAGNVPNEQAQGTVGLGVGGGGGQYTDTGVDGTIMVSIQPMGGVNFAPNTLMAPTRANIQGTVVINPQTQQDIIYRMGGMSGGMVSTQPYPQQYPQQQAVPCVSGIAIDTGFAGGYSLYGTKVYLYLNGTSHGYILSL